MDHDEGGLATAALMTSVTHHARLLSHDSTPCPALHSITAQVQRSHSALTLRFRLRGDLSQLVIPAPAPAEPRDGLWQHTCCEAFVRADGQERYQEFNFAPSGQWAAYEFQGYRNGMQPLPIAPQIQSAQDDAALLLTAAIMLPAELHHRPLLLGLSAVIELRRGGLCYWALAHPGERPDFHHRAGHVLAIEAPA